MFSLRNNFPFRLRSLLHFSWRVRYSGQNRFPWGGASKHQNEGLPCRMSISALQAR